VVLPMYLVPASQVADRPAARRYPKSRKTLPRPFTLDQRCSQPNQEGVGQMSDVSQGPGWWLASDGKWYPPESESHSPSAQVPAATRFTKRTWENIVIGGLAVGALGLILPWVSAGFLSANGLDTGDGRLYGILLLATAFLVVMWRRRGVRMLGYFALAGALLMAAVAVYDVIHVSTSHGPLGISVSPGVGLIFDAIAGVGTTIAIWKVLRWPVPTKEPAVVGPETSPSE
jgi:hypothetical protein